MFVLTQRRNKSRFKRHTK